MVEAETRRHGSLGYKIAEIFESESFKKALADTGGATAGLLPSNFYTVSIAPDPLQPMVLKKVGYVRKLVQDRGKAFLYEFYDSTWNRLGYLTSRAELFRTITGKKEDLGKFQIEAAVARLFPAPSGYGYDHTMSDLKRSQGENPDVSADSPEGRGVFHRSHQSAPPVVVFRHYRAGEAKALASQYERAISADRSAAKLRRLREARHGGFGEDEEYGGLRYKDGNPVDENGRPMRPRSIK